MDYNGGTFIRQMATGMAKHACAQNVIHKRMLVALILYWFSLCIGSYFGSYDLKYLVLILVLYFVYSYLRRERLKGQADPSTQTTNAPQIMLECNACGVHFPQNEAIKGELGQYCCEAHLRAK